MGAKEVTSLTIPKRARPIRAYVKELLETRGFKDVEVVDVFSAGEADGTTTVIFHAEGKAKTAYVECEILDRKRDGKVEEVVQTYIRVVNGWPISAPV